MHHGGGIQAEYSISLDTCIDNVRYVHLSANGMFLRRDGLSTYTCPSLYFSRCSTHHNSPMLVSLIKICLYRPLILNF